jgi:hypothetical protein
MTDNDDDTEASDLSNAFLELMTSMTQVLDATVGYRTRCEQQGFSSDACETMSLDLHQHMMAICFRQAGA